MLDPAPRVVLDPELGVRHRRPHAPRTRPSPPTSTSTRSTSSCAPTLWAAIGRCRRADIFDVEYWDLEQAKLAAAGNAAGLRRRGRAGHRRGVGHRQSRASRRCSRAARRWLASISIRRSRTMLARARLSRCARATSTGRGRRRARAGRGGARRSAGWTCWCSTRASSRPARRIDGAAAAPSGDA